MDDSSSYLEKAGIAVEVRGKVAEVILQGAPVNAIGADTYHALISTFKSFSERTDVNVVILRSGLRLFSAGADIKEELDDPSFSESAAEYRQRLAHACYEAIIDCALPTIAVVNGAALGAGAVLAACCDIRLASTDAQIGLPEITAGRCGGGRHLMRIASQGRTRLMYFTGDPITADEAYRLDIVQHISDPESLLVDARALADRIAANSPLGLRLAKRALNEAESLPVSAGYAREQRYTLILGKHPDAREAARSKIEKRSPEWKWPAEQVASAALL